MSKYTFDLDKMGLGGIKTGSLELDPITPSKKSKKKDKKDKKTKKRRAFSEEAKLQCLIRQKKKCAKCGKELKKNKKHYHHSDGDRSNNDPDNCECWCKDCHDEKNFKHKTKNKWF